jgi:hypothetical protein
MEQRPAKKPDSLQITRYGKKIQRDIFQARNGLSYRGYAAEIRPFRTVHLSRCTKLLGRAAEPPLESFFSRLLHSFKRTFFSLARGMVPDVSVCSTTSDHPTALPALVANCPETWIGV